MFNQAMNILGGQESYNTPALKKCKWLQSQNKIRPYTTLNIYTLLNVFTKHKQTKKKSLGGPHVYPKHFKGSNKADHGLSTSIGGKKSNTFNH